MPELPEVETTRRGIQPHIEGHAVTKVVIRNPKLRWPVPPQLGRTLKGLNIQAIDRRGKYLLLKTEKGTLLIHLGMSGSLRISEPDFELRKHDHVIIQFDNNLQLRLHDPRRFGAVLWTKEAVENHALISSLGPEPLLNGFNSEYLYQSCIGKKTSIKQHIMNSKIVVGVGNIYASESLFLAGIHPKRQAGKISKVRCEKLTEAIKSILIESIKQGGTTLRDFVRENGEPGYFKQRLNVYGRAGEPCPKCENPVRQITQGQRSTFYCYQCQR